MTVPLAPARPPAPGRHRAGAGARVSGASTRASAPSTGARAVAAVRASRAAQLALLVLTVTLVATIAGPWLSPYGEREIRLTMELQRPSWPHLFGTDAYGRDVFTRTLYGGRVSLAVALLATSVAATLGTAVGLAAGYAGDRLDALLMRGVDTMLALPRLLLLIGILAVWPSLPTPVFVVVLGATAWFPLSRMVRARVRAERERDYVQAARALGAGHARLMLRHLLPAAAGTVLVAATLLAGQVIVLEAGLGFLGLGVQPPAASWGNIAADGYAVVSSAWWVALCPGLAIAVTVTALNLLGDVLRDAVDPRQLPQR